MANNKRHRTIVLPRLEKWQRDVYDDMADSRGSGKTFVVKSKRQIGKSTLATVMLIKFALEKRCTSAMVQPTLKQARKVFKQLLQMMEGSNTIASSNAQTLEITFTNGSEIIFGSSEQKEALRGYTVTGLLVIDEAAYITDDVFDTISPWVDAHKAPTLIISTPLFADGFFFRMFHEKTCETYDWSIYDTSKYLTEEKKNQYKRTMTSMKYRSEILGEFITDGSFVFTNINSCLHTDELPIKQGYVLAIDWASGGGGDSDFTWLTWMDADTKKVIKVDYFNDKTPNEQIEYIANVINLYKPKKVTVEINSIGSVYKDVIQAKTTVQIEAFATTNESKRRIIEQLVTAFQKGEISIPNDAELIRQIQHYAVEKTKSGYTYNGMGAHDDAVMSLAICYDSILKKDGNYVVKVRRNKRKKSMSIKYG